MATVYISRSRRRRRRAEVLTAVLLVAATAAGGVRLARVITSTRETTAVDNQVRAGSLAWPVEGEAAVAVGRGPLRSSGGTAAVPIASLAKVMTALVVLRTHPLRNGEDGPSIEITADDVADTAARRAEGQSVVPVVDGERLTERQALEAILLPSANNIASVVARSVGGSTALFVDRMNREARRLHMTATRYTDPSGFDPRTVSSAGDQVLLARAAMTVTTLADIVRMKDTVLPIAGRVVNTDSLVGRNGFVGIKTGSDAAAGGCFMFAFRYVRDGRSFTIFGAVLGQRGGPLIAAGLRAGQRLAVSLAAALSSAQAT